MITRHLRRTIPIISRSNKIHSNIARSFSISRRQFANPTEKASEYTEKGKQVASEYGEKGKEKAQHAAHQVKKETGMNNNQMMIMAAGVLALGLGVYYYYYSGDKKEEKK